MAEGPPVQYFNMACSITVVYSYGYRLFWSHPQQKGHSGQPQINQARTYS